jgi:anaerobic magnesium-protoporphyrin IX monomethyl ester cyclase
MNVNNKICLITPPSPFLLDERVFMHIGILKVASSLESKGISVDVLDLSGVNNFEDVISDYARSENSAKIFGITATTPQVPYAVKIAQQVREIDKDVKLILGGPHVTLMNAASKMEIKNGLEKSDRATKDVVKLSSYFDTLVCGDGEFSVFEALSTNSRIIDADDRKSSLFLSNEDFSTLPMPARHLVDVDSYHYEIEGRQSISLIAQLGCPFKCAFCSGRNSPFLRKIRTRSIESIVEEIDHLYKAYGMTGFMFYDDELNVNKSMIPLMNELSNLQDKLGVDFRLRGFVKAELFNKEQADAMYRAGFRWLLTGFESGDERILKTIQKIATKDDNTRAVEVAKNAGLKVKALMSVGHAGENEKSIENTKNWLLDVKPEEFDCTVITTYPGSPYFDEAVKSGDHYTYTSKLTGDRLYQSSIDYCEELDYYKGDPEGGYVSYVWTDHLSPSEIVNLRDDLESTVRKKLGISFNPGRPGINYEHSMGMGNISLPDHILRKTKD